MIRGMKREDPQFKFRMPADLKARLDAEAEKNTRTLGAEIVARLQSTFKPEQKTFDFEALPGIIDGLRGELLTQKQAIAELAKAGAEVTYGPDGEMKKVRMTVPAKATSKKR